MSGSAIVNAIKPYIKTFLSFFFVFLFFLFLFNDIPFPSASQSVPFAHCPRRAGQQRQEKRKNLFLRWRSTRSSSRRDVVSKTSASSSAAYVIASSCAAEPRVISLLPHSRSLMGHKTVRVLLLLRVFLFFIFSSCRCCSVRGSRWLEGVREPSWASGLAMGAVGNRSWDCSVDAAVV